MKNESYTATIEVALSPDVVFDRINQVSNWWSKDYTGKSTALSDEFIISHGDRHYSKQKLVEVIPNKKIVWQVTESRLNWIENNKAEWTNTKMVFELSTEADKTVLNFAHEGLVPGQECYSRCTKGWDLVIKESLYNLITNTKISILKEHQDFSYSLTVKAPAKETMKKISQVDLWWAKKFKGKASKLNDEFSVYFGDTYVNFRISEVIPDKKIIWLVTDCNLHWIKDKKEWKNTETIWTLTENSGKTQIDFVHKGLTPDRECYESCKPGWTQHLKDSLQKLVDEGKGFPE